MTLGLALVVSPAVAGVSVVGSLTHERIVSIGNSYQGVILLKNVGKEPAEAKVYQRDYLFFADGHSVYRDPGSVPRSNAAWITMSPKRVSVAPGHVVSVNYGIQVPSDSTLSGTYWSLLMVEEITSGSPEASKPSQDKVTFGVTQVVRYGLQIVNHIENTGTTELKFSATKLLNDETGKILQVDVENTGTRWFRTLLWADLFDETGGFVGRFDAGTLRAYPGTSVRFKINVSEVPPGTYKALVVADCGGDAVFGATYTLKLKD